MPEANDVNFREAEKKLQEIQSVVNRSRQEWSPGIWAAKTPPVEAVSAVRKAVKAVVSAVTDSPGHRVVANPDSTVRVVHYTSVENAIAMLEDASKEDGGNWRLRMSHTAGFNDKAEGQYLFEAYGLAKAADIGLMPASTRRNLPQRDQDQEHHAYAVCFVTPQSLDIPHDYHIQPSPPEADNVTFWATPYGRNGNGVALTVTLQPDSLYRVRYGPKAAQNTAGTVAQYCESILDTVRQLQSAAIEELTKRIIQEEVTLLRYLYKDQSFEDERESRAISIRRPGDANIDPVMDNGVFKSYYRSDDMSADKIFSSGSSITLGPRVRNRASAMLHIRQLVRQSKYPHICVWASESSYGLSDNR